MEFVVMKKDIQGRNLQHHEEYKIKVPPDEEKNITHLRFFLKNYKYRSTCLKNNAKIEITLTHHKGIAVIILQRQAGSAYYAL
jgi:hypothetical protein